MSTTVHRLSSLAPFWLLLGCTQVLLTQCQLGNVSTQIKGWIQVDMQAEPSEQLWPIEENHYFIATEKRHHFISVKLPVEPTRDLDVRLEFYYNYKRLRPTIQFVPCTEFFQIKEAKGSNGKLQPIEKKQWLSHEYRVRRTDCLRRDELQYDILLQDADDVFAFRKMSVKYVDLPLASTTNRPESDQALDLVTAVTGSSSSAKPTPSDSISETATTLFDIWTGEATSETGTTFIEVDSFTTDSTPQSSTVSSIATDDVEKLPWAEDSPKTTTTTTAASTSTTQISSTETPKTSVKGFSFETTTATLDEYPSTYLHSDWAKSTSTTPTPELTSDWSASRPLALRRRKRFAITTGAQAKPIEINEVCTPKKCDRKVFEVSARFISIINALPKIPNSLAKSSSKQLYKLNGRPQPLEWLLRQEDSCMDSFADSDACINFNLFMDANCTLDMVLEPEPAQPKSHSSQPQTVERLLETFRSDEPGWRNIERCMSSYMPNYTPLTELDSDRSLKLTFKPTKSHPSDRIIALIDKNRSASLRQPFRVKSFIPSNEYLHEDDARNSIGDFWVLESDSLRKPKIGFENVSIASTSAQTTGTLTTNSSLVVSDIDLNERSFALTSRWLKVEELDVTNGHIVFNYRADIEDWLEAVHFDTQLANSDWVEQEVYKRPFKAPNLKLVDPSKATSGGSAESGASSLGSGNDTARPHQELFIPIAFKGFSAREYRVRLRHMIGGQKEKLDPNLNNKMRISLLSLGDSCVGKYSCLHGGRCVPTGPMKIRCICRPGYSGRFCEKVNACDVLHFDDMSGREICQKFNASCIENIPELRCVWPNDKYMQCKSTKYFNFDKMVPLDATFTTSAPHTQAEDSMQAQQVDPKTSAVTVDESATNEKQKSMIIMCVLMIAAVIFFVVILLNMLVRLRKSKDKLEQSEMQLYELNRRVQQQPTSWTGNGRSQGTSQTVVKY